MRHGVGFAPRLVDPYLGRLVCGESEVHSIRRVSLAKELRPGVPVSQCTGSPSARSRTEDLGASIVDVQESEGSPESEIYRSLE